MDCRIIRSSIQTMTARATPPPSRTSTPSWATSTGRTVPETQAAVKFFLYSKVQRT